MHWPQFWCKNYVRFAFILIYFVGSSWFYTYWCPARFQYQNDVRFVHHKCDGPTGTGVIYSSAGRGFTLCFMMIVVQFLVFLASFCWPVFYGECCSVFSILVSFCWPVFSPISCWLLYCFVFLRYVSSDYSLGIFKIFL